MLIRKRIEENKIKIIDVENEPVKEIMKTFNIEKGESESIVLAIKEKDFSATDDGKAIRVASILGLKYLTVLSFILLLCYKKKITSKEATIMINKIANYGRYKKELIDHALKEVK